MSQGFNYIPHLHINYVFRATHLKYNTTSHTHTVHYSTSCNKSQWSLHRRYAIDTLRLNAYNISMHMYPTIKHILYLSHTPNLNHNVIIPKQHIITPHESYTHHTILIYIWHKYKIYLWTMQYTQLLNFFFKIILTRCASKWLDSLGSHSGVL